MTDFARSQLLKYGWSEGKGLGKNENGITEALKPKLKFDTTGVGHESTEYQWWKFVYNKASSNIDINNDDDGEVKMRVKDKNAVEIATSKSELNLRRLKKDSNYNLHFGNFIKTSTLQDGKDSINDSDHVETVIDKSASMSEFPSGLNDEALFKACGGRTAHKGARHGLTLSGKLARLQQQEEELLAKMKNSGNLSEPSTSSPWTQVQSKKIKKNRKRKSEQMDMDNDVAVEDNSVKTETNNVKSLVDNSKNISVAPVEEGESEVSPKVKSKRARLKEKRKFENLSYQMEKSLDLTADNTSSTEPEKKKKKKKKRALPVAEDSQCESEELNKKKKKKKSKKNDKNIEVVNLDRSIEVVNLEDENADDAGFYEISVEESEPKPKKKKKNKSKKEVINADKLNKKIIMKKSKKLEKKKLEKLSESLITLALDDNIVENVTAKVSKKKKKNSKNKSKTEN